MMLIQLINYQSSCVSKYGIQKVHRKIYFLTLSAAFQSIHTYLRQPWSGFGQPQKTLEIGDHQAAKVGRLVVSTRPTIVQYGRTPCMPRPFCPHCVLDAMIQVDMGSPNRGTFQGVSLKNHDLRAMITDT